MAGMDELVHQDTSWGDHSHPTNELLWNRHGASRVTVGARTWTITPHLGVWMPAGTVHSGFAAAGTWYRTTHFGVRTSPAMSAGPAAVEITDLLRLLLQRVAEPGLAARSRSTTEAMVLDVMRPSDREITVHRPESALLAPVVTAIEADPADQRTLADWAAELGVSTRTVARAFSQETGLGFTRWVASVRAHHAVVGLAAGEDVEVVAESVGYRSVSAFGAAFRRTTGVTPGWFAPRRRDVNPGVSESR